MSSERDNCLPDDYKLPSRHSVVHLCSTFDHLLGLEFTGSSPRTLGQKRPEPVVGYEGSGGANKGWNVAGRDENPALPVLDDFRQATDRKSDRWNSQGHCIDDGGAQAFGSSRMPEYVESGHCVVDL